MDRSNEQHFISTTSFVNLGASLGVLCDTKAFDYDDDDDNNKHLLKHSHVKQFGSCLFTIVDWFRNYHRLESRGSPFDSQLMMMTVIYYILLLNDFFLLLLIFIPHDFFCLV